MATNEERPQRKSPRADWLEYNEGRYFVTVCTRDHRHYFGKIEHSVITLTDVGRFLDEELKNISLNHSYAEMVQYVVMPNHFHAIIDIVGTQRIASETNNRKQADALRCVPTREQRLTEGIRIKHRTLLASCIGGIKAAVTRYARANGIPFAWQPRYHDHAIRDYNDMTNISQYIENNVLNWEKDCFY